MAKATATELEVAGHPVRISNPDKIYFPERGFTKLDVVQYYLNVGDGILRALRERPTTLERWPGGVVPGAKLSTRADHTGDAFLPEAIPTKGVPSGSRRPRSSSPACAPPTNSARSTWPTWPGPRRWARSSSTRGRCVAPMWTLPMSCAST
jgi:hypothetical protein